MANNEELVGQLTMVMMALLGMLIYSLVVGVLTVGSGAAILELGMVWAHLFVSLACAVGQLGLAPALPEGHVPGMAFAQSACFAGIALGVTCVGVACCNGDGDVCATYFPSALLPKASAVGAITWAWIMYVASLGAQSVSRGLSLAFTTPAGAWTTLVSAAAGTALVQRSCSSKVQGPDPAYIWLLCTASGLAYVGLALGGDTEVNSWKVLGWILQLVALVTGLVCVLAGPMQPLVAGLMLGAMSLQLVVMQVVVPWWRNAPHNRRGGRKLHP
jgi:hypothetical protein